MRKTGHALGFRVPNSSAVYSLVLIIMVFLVGCSTANVQQVVSSYESFPEHDQGILLQPQADFFEFERYHRVGGDVILENLADAAVEQQVMIKEDDEIFQPDCRYEAELAGRLWLPVPEPDLIEDPLIQDLCVENAHTWCAPDVEDIYLSYIELEKQLKYEASIFPNFIAPIDDALVLRGMQSPSKKYRGHYGLDLIPASWEGRGTPIKSVEDGVVVLSGRASGYGYYVIVYHQNGLFSLYSHLLKNKPVKAGQEVQRGEPVGYMGKSGNARGYHLHFELIDLRETWNFERDIDTFVTDFNCGCVPKKEVGTFCKLLFNKVAKVDPFPQIPDLVRAKKVNGKWVAVPAKNVDVQQKTAQGQ